MGTLRTGLTVAFLAGLLLAPGCVMPDQLSQMEKDVADIQQRMLRIESDQAESQRLIRELADEPRQVESEVTRADLAEVVVQVDQVSRQMAIAGERMNDIEQRLDQFSQDLQRARDANRRPVADEVTLEDAEPLLPAESDDPGDPGPAAPGAVPDPEALYNSAYADFSKGNYALAISGFEEYQQRYPDSALADNALYWIAECHFSQGNFPAAIDALDHLLELYPRSDKAAAGNLKKALAFLEQNQVGQAIVQLRYVVTGYPGTDEARLARDKLSSLGASVN